MSPLTLDASSALLLSAHTPHKHPAQLHVDGKSGELPQPSVSFAFPPLALFCTFSCPLVPLAKRARTHTTSARAVRRRTPAANTPSPTTTTTKRQKMAPMPEGAADTGSLVIKNLAYSYPGGKEIISDFSLELPPGSRCLLSGANGAGKTTLLQVLAGKTMVSEDSVRVIGKPPFHDINLTCSGDLGYLGSQWRRNIGSAVRTCEKKRRRRALFFSISLFFFFRANCSLFILLSSPPSPRWRQEEEEAFLRTKHKRTDKTHTRLSYVVPSFAAPQAALNGVLSLIFTSPSPRLLPPSLLLLLKKYEQHNRARWRWRVTSARVR